MVDIPVLIGSVEHRIRTNSRNWIICRQVMDSEKKEPYWQGMSFYSNLEGLIQGLFELKLKKSNAKTIAGLKNNMTKITKELSEVYGKAAFQKQLKES
jgi:hypothetical protein